MIRAECRGVLLGLVAAVMLPLPAAGAEAIQERVGGSFPDPKMKALGSGSGVLIDARYVLTNRHVAFDEEGRKRAGFYIHRGPDFKSRGPAAHVIWTCKNYDLAILEIKEPLATSRLAILDGAPALGQKVTAYGFPLGDAFGIGLTTTGGQVTRQPVADEDPNNDDEARLIRHSLWHDAITSGGSSGGPLFSEQGVLVGLHFGSLIERHGIAVPADVISSFLRRTDAANGIDFVPSDKLSAYKPPYEPQALTVFVEVVGTESNDSPNEPRTTDLGRVPADLRAATQQAIEKRLRDRLPRLAADELAEVRKGNFSIVFPISQREGIRKEAVVRIQSQARVVQVFKNGILLNIDGMLARIVWLNVDGSELRARLGGVEHSDVVVDDVFLVGPAVDYQTTRGRTGSYILLIPAGEVVDDKRIDELVKAESARRRSEKLAAEKAARAKVRESLRHTFHDASDKFTIDAVIVAVDGQKRTADLVKVANGETVTVALDRLSGKDRTWISRNVAEIRQHGKAIADDLATEHGTR